jgi:hypothetical protein
VIPFGHSNQIARRILANPGEKMSTIKLPDPLARRHLMEGGLDPEKARAYADAYLEAGREVEAVDFLEMADAKEALAALQDTAVARGDVFLMRAASRALGDEPTSAIWTQLVEAAKAAGRLRDAETAQRLATVSE